MTVTEELDPRDATEVTVGRRQTGGSDGGIGTGVDVYGAEVANPDNYDDTDAHGDGLRAEIDPLLFHAGDLYAASPVPPQQGGHCITGSAQEASGSPLASLWRFVCCCWCWCLVSCCCGGGGGGGSGGNRAGSRKTAKCGAVTAPKKRRQQRRSQMTFEPKKTPGSSGRSGGGGSGFTGSSKRNNRGGGGRRASFFMRASSLSTSSSSSSSSSNSNSSSSATQRLSRAESSSSSSSLSLESEGRYSTGGLSVRALCVVVHAGQKKQTNKQISLHTNKSFHFMPYPGSSFDADSFDGSDELADLPSFACGGAGASVATSSLSGGGSGGGGGSDDGGRKVEKAAISGSGSESDNDHTGRREMGEHLVWV